MKIETLKSMSDSELDSYIDSNQIYKIWPEKGEILRSRIKLYKSVYPKLFDAEVISENNNFTLSKEYLSFFDNVYVHWTNKKNIKLILSSGLKSPKVLKKSGDEFNPAETFSDMTRAFKGYGYKDNYRTDTMENYVRLGNQNTPTYTKWYQEFKDKPMSEIAIFLFDSPNEIPGGKHHGSEIKFKDRVDKEYISKIILVPENDNHSIKAVIDESKELLKVYPSLQECIIILREDIIRSMSGSTYTEIKILRRKDGN